MSLYKNVCICIREVRCISKGHACVLKLIYNLFTPWNTAKIGIKHQSFNSILYHWLIIYYVSKRLSNNISNEIQLLNIYRHFYWPQYYFGFIQRLRIWMNCTKSRQKCVTYVWVLYNNVCICIREVRCISKGHVCVLS
jgi:hypothetical protein